MQALIRKMTDHKPATQKFAVLRTVTDRAQNGVGNVSIYSRHRTFAAAEREMLKQNESADIYSYNVGDWNGTEYIPVEW